MPLITDHILPTTGYRSPTTDHRLPITNNRPHDLLIFLLLMLVMTSELGYISLSSFNHCGFHGGIFRTWGKSVGKI